MIIIYHDVGGCHSSAVAASIHANKLESNHCPSKEDLNKLETFDKLRKDQVGHLIYIGKDETGNKIFTLCRRHKQKLVIPAITDIYNETSEYKDDLYLIDTSPCVNNMMRIGGFLSRGLNFVSMGRPIVTFGTQKAYDDICSIVKDAKNKIQNIHKKNDLIQ